ncbi:uncharacterized protein DUF1080 [Thermoflavifilum aggregans]|uniref:Uncharacterized protein DUF1080 n=1 Tax=Thermoflavifilum aggregans TaxID=454188 RepID=A0A2M9CXT2_9BACT|nr:DUF1080 domain-containing protein [Thermoflavifilum aggregans]PJJ76687.1 uncharacterized protein DUF1080 [Thermoflavifilum aggregans]
MQRICWTICLFFVLGALQMPAAAQTASRHKWISLFNSRDLTGWHSYHQSAPAPAWKVQDGAIVLDHSGNARGGDLVTDREYSNFELELQWKISKGGNSGILFLVHEDPRIGATYFTGPEMQVLDNQYADDNKIPSHLAGSLYDLIAADPKAVHPYGAWNTVRIKLLNGHLTFWMNGEKVVETQLWTPQWDSLVAHSKFTQWPVFATYHTGHIALQDHGDEVWFRNIRIREL